MPHGDVPEWCRALVAARVAAGRFVDINVLCDYTLDMILCRDFCGALLTPNGHTWCGVARGPETEQTEESGESEVDEPELDEGRGGSSRPPFDVRSVTAPGTLGNVYRDAVATGRLRAVVLGAEELQAKKPPAPPASMNTSMYRSATVDESSLEYMVRALEKRGGEKDKVWVLLLDAQHRLVMPAVEARVSMRAGPDETSMVVVEVTDRILPSDAEKAVHAHIMASLKPATAGMRQQQNLPNLPNMRKALVCMPVGA